MSARQASSASQTPHLSPAELSYIYTSLSLPNTPIRPDGRSSTQFRPLTAETDILPGTNGSARIGFADGTQAIVGVKAEVEKTVVAADALDLRSISRQAQGESLAMESGEERESAAAGEDRTATGQGSWVQMSIEIPGFRDDDALPVFLAEMMREPLVGSVSGGGGGGKGEDGEMAGGLKGRLVINRRWHWRLYIDVSFYLVVFVWGYTNESGPSSVATTVISAPIALPHNTLGSPLNKTPQTQIQRRRRPLLRRRLGRCRIPLPPHPYHSQHPQIRLAKCPTPNHPPRHFRRRKHHLRP